VGLTHENFRNSDEESSVETGEKIRRLMSSTDLHTPL